VSRFTRRLLFVSAVVVAVIVAPAAGAAIDVGITSPQTGAHSLSGVVSVLVNASADQGIYSVQLEVDGVPFGIPDTTPVGPYQYEVDWDTSGVTVGNHTLSVLATDWSQIGGGVQQASDPVTVDVGPAYPTLSLIVPQAYTFQRGTVALSSTVSGGQTPTVVVYSVDGNPLPGSSWNTTTVPDGSHTVSATVTDGRGKTATDSVPVTVDNTPPSTNVASLSSAAAFNGTVSVSANASDAYGIRSVQFQIDGQPAGTLMSAPDGGSGFTYTQTLSLAGLALGVHTLTDAAVDAAGNTTSSAPVSFTITVPSLSATLTMPLDWTFASKTVPVLTSITGGAGPFSVQLYVDGKPSGTAITQTPYSLSWDTTKVADGAHTVSVVVTDTATQKTAMSQTVHQTVDNTPPTAVMYQPAAGSHPAGTVTFQVHASDAYGIKSVQFTVDGNPVGALLTKPDTTGGYLYTISFDTSTLAAGSHAVSALVTDNAGNVTTAAPVTITSGPLQYLPVLNYHGIDTKPPDQYELTPAEADQQLAYLKAQGYQSVTLEQYQAWLAGQNIGVAKPVLITVDDGLTDQLAWDPLLQKYGFHAVLFVITGFADETTPGDADPTQNMSWQTIQSLAANGRWEIAFHAGQYGHGDSYDTDAKIGNQSYTSACPYFYSCLSQTTTGSGRNAKTTVETVAALKTAVTNEMTAGMAELKQKVPSASFVAWAAPFNDAGQWTNLYNDPSGQVAAWLPGFMASKFQITFTQTNPVTYGQASGLVGSLTGYGRHYRFEVDDTTTMAQYQAALADPAFAR
jgi:Bacterial Ig domain/Polysaccharide deacetylase